MTSVVYAFAFDPELKPVPNAAPFDVLARQLPRMIVTVLNGGTDRGLRFFPFLGQVDGRRRFFDLPSLMAPDQLLSLHGQNSTPDLLVDAILRRDSALVRFHSGADGAERFSAELAFSPTDPWGLVRRVTFELCGALGLGGIPPEPPSLSGRAVGWYLIVRDALLMLEAELIVIETGAILSACSELLQLAVGVADVDSTVAEVCRRMIQLGVEVDRTLEFLVGLGASDRPMGERILTEAARLIESTAGLGEAAPVYDRLARDYSHAGAAVKAGVGMFQAGRIEDSRRALRRAIEAGSRDPQVRAQLAAVEELAGDLAARDALLEELASDASADAEIELPMSVVRMLAGYLIDRQRAEDALALIDRALDMDSEAVSSHGIWLERARALIALRRGEEGRVAIDRCLALEPTDAARLEVERLSRFTGDGDVLGRLRNIEQALAVGDIRVALVQARRLVAERPNLPEAFLFLGVSRQRLGHIRRAVKAYRRALALDGRLGDAHNRLGVLLASTGKEREGYNHLRFAVELQPADGAAWIHLAQVCRHLGHDEEGREAIERAEKLGGFGEQLQLVKRLFSDRSR